MAYGKIQETFWDDPGLRALAGRNEDVRWLMLYLLTCRHRNRLGCYVLDLRYAAADLDWPVDRVEAALALLEEADRVRYDREHRIVFVVRFLRYNVLDNHKVVTGAIAELESLPSTPLLVPLLAAIEENARDHYAKLVEAARLRCQRVRRSLGEAQEERAPNGTDNGTANGIDNGIGDRTPYSGTAQAVAVAVPVTRTTPGSIDPEAAPRSEGDPEPSAPAEPTPSGADLDDDPHDLGGDEEERRIGARLAPLIREELWRDKYPPPLVVRSDPGWNMARELSVCRRLLQRDGVTLDVLEGAIRHARAALGFAPDVPLTTKIFQVKGRYDRFEVAVAAWRRTQMRDAPGPQKVEDILAPLIAAAGGAHG